MPICGIVGCSNRTGVQKDLSFFKVPKIVTGQGDETRKLSEERRRVWKAAINRPYIQREDIWERTIVCSKHFVGGVKAYLHDRTNPSWSPTLYLGTQSSTSPCETNKTALDRFGHVRGRKEKTVLPKVASSLLSLKKRRIKFSSTTHDLGQQIQDTCPGALQQSSTSTSNDMSSGQPPAPLVIEGYQVFAEGNVKQEPVDQEDSNAPKPSNSQQNGQASEDTESGQSIRELLRQMVDNRNKDLTVKNVVEALVIKNQLVLEQSNAQSFKPQQRKSKSTEQLSHGSILQPKDPTGSCTYDDIANINEAIVEVGVIDADDSLGIDTVCAVGSKVLLMTPQGQPLQMDLTCFWCNFCSFKSEKKEALLQHVMEHRFHCKYCKFQAFSRAMVISHCREEHSGFDETAKTLKYCTYLPDYIQQAEQKSNKRKATEPVESVEKRSKIEEEPDPLNMEVEEVDDAGNRNKKEMNKTLIPRKATARKSLPSPTVSSETLNKIRSKLPDSSRPEPVSDTTSLPVISSVVSGEKAISEATQSSISVQDGSSSSSSVSSTLKPASPHVELQNSGSITVSTGLCWNCGYCGFVTLSQAFLKIHLNAKHQGMTHKYVAMLASSEEELARIKASDAQLLVSPTGTIDTAEIPPISQDTVTAMNSVSKTLSVPSPASPIVQIDNAEKGSDSEEETEEEKRIPVSYKCAHCNYTSPQAERIKYHLFQRHNGSVMYALDMKAVKLRKKRYVFFCMKEECKFLTKDVDTFLDHTDTCTPWLKENSEARKKANSLTVTSLELTKQFVQKSLSSKTTTATKSVKQAEYGCVYCLYSSTNNTRVKKHVMSNHQEKPTVIKDLHAAKSNKPESVYFCKLCLWETRTESELATHMPERHGKSLVEVDKKVDDVSSVTSATSSVSDENDISSRESSQAPVDDHSDTPENVNEYEGLVHSNEYEKAMADYVKDEESVEKKSRGRPSRNAALKAKVRVKLVKPPPLYKCMHCSHIAFGTKLMRNHINNEHKNEAIRAIDMLKSKKNLQNPYCCFCPILTCTFSAAMATDVINHAKNSHGMRATSPQLLKLSESFTSPKQSPSRTKPASASTGESYECLYCESFKIVHSRHDMKKHLHEAHTDEDFLFRDCIAHKLRQPSRWYMCPNYHCDATFEKQSAYSLHVLAHKNTKIFECSKCQWFSPSREEWYKHIADVHTGEDMTPVEVELKLDGMGEVIRMVNGTIIKPEKS